MQTIQGEYNSAKVFTDIIDEASINQIKTLLDQEYIKDSKIRLMPDVHAGAGCTIGTTMTIKDKVCPNLVGVDVGCGMETLVVTAGTEISARFDEEKLDALIKQRIPSGYAVRNEPHPFIKNIDLSKVRGRFSKDHALLSLGTLGGGNHFIEANRDEEGNLYFVIHSGSRHAGLEIAEYYQKAAWEQLNKSGKDDIQALIYQLKKEGREKEIQSALEKTRAQVITQVPEALAYVSGELFADYINDMKCMQQFAFWSRKAMMEEIIRGLGILEKDILCSFTTIHNYIDTDNMILRKGAVSAQKGELILIPMNMRDGSLICVGKGNPDWNYSAPHGAGRLMSRKKAMKDLSLEKFKKEMKGIYSSTVVKETLDESPMAYKPMKSIIENIAPAAEITKIIKPVFNFKAAETRKF